MNGICRICGTPGEGQEFETWVKQTFTNFDLLKPGKIICNDCLFWFERPAILTERTGKDKQQRMVNYSHFIKGGEWTPLGKGDKRAMADLLIASPFPELAAIAISGQKHIVFRARRNPAGSKAGWVQVEEQSLWVDPAELAPLLGIVESLYTEFSKGEIESGNYYSSRIYQFGLVRWQELEAQIKPARGTALFQLAIFLAQRKEQEIGDGTTETGGRGSLDSDLAGNASGLQEPLPNDDLGAVRERDPERGLHVKPGQVRQLPLFPDERGHWAE